MNSDKFSLMRASKILSWRRRHLKETADIQEHCFAPYTGVEYLLRLIVIYVNKSKMMILVPSWCIQNPLKIDKYFFFSLHQFKSDIANAIVSSKLNQLIMKFIGQTCKKNTSRKLRTWQFFWSD